MVVAAELRIGQRLLLSDVREALRTAHGIRVCGESPDDAVRRNGKPADIEELLQCGYEGNVHYDPVVVNGRSWSKKIVFHRNPDYFVFDGMTPGY